MARKLGYGGIANTNGARNFAGKTPAVGGAFILAFVDFVARSSLMAIRNQALTVNFLAWDTNANVGKTGDSGNFTMRLVKDGGTAAELTNALSEPDSTNMPGIYEVALTATEMDANFVTLHGMSSTLNIVIYPLFITTERGDLATVDTVVDGIQTDLDNGTDGLGAIKTDTASILVDTNSLNDTKIPDTISLAAINAEVDTALTDYDAVVPGDLPTNFGSMGIEADGHVHGDVKEWDGNAVTASSGNPDVNVETMDSGVIASGTFSAGAIDAAAIAADALGTAEIADAAKGTLIKNATNTFPMQMVDATDGFTAETGLTPTLTRSIDGASFAAKDASSTVTEIGNGWYWISAVAADTNGDVIIYRLTDATSRDSYFFAKTIAS